MRTQDSLSVAFRFAALHEAELIRAIEYDAAQRFADIDMVGIASARPMEVEFVRRKIGASEIVIALDGDARGVGFVMFVQMPAGYYIEELDVLRAWGGRRIGAALIDCVAGLARTAGKQRLM